MSDTPTSKVEALRETIGRRVHGDFHAIHGWDTPLVNGLLADFATFLEDFTEEKKKIYITELAWKHSAGEDAVPVEALHQVVTALRGGE